MNAPHLSERARRLAIAMESNRAGDDVAPIIVWSLDESVKRQLAARAKRNGRSMEAEVRDILARAVHRSPIGAASLDAGLGIDATRAADLE